MKIALLASGTVASSLTARLVHLGRELAAQGHEVYLFAPSADKYNNFKKEKVSKLEGMTVVQPYQFATHKAAYNFLPYIPLALLKLLFLKPDIVYLYKPTPLTVIGLVAGWRKKTKVVLDMDDLGSEVMAREGNSTWMVRVVDWCERTSARHADAIVVVSSFLEKKYAKEFPNKLIAWVPNGVRSVKPFKSPQKPRLFFIGSLNSRDVLEPLFDALPDVARKYADSKNLVHIVGDGSERAYFEELMQKKELKEMVQFHGWIASEHLGDLVAAGDLGYYCVPDTEPFKAASSQKIFDYMSYGIVPIVNEVGDLPYYINYGTVGYLSSEDLSSTIVKALQDKAGRAQRSAQAQARVKELFLWKHLAARVESIYDRTLNTQKNP